MGAVKPAPASRRPPHGGGGGRTGALPGREGGAGRGGLPGGGDGGRGVGGLPGGKGYVAEPIGRSSGGVETHHEIGGTPGGGGGGGRRGLAVEANGRAARGSKIEHGTGGNPRRDVGAGNEGTIAGSGGGACRLQGGGEEVAGIGAELGGRNELAPFSGFVILCIDLSSSKLTEEVFQAYKEKIQNLGGTNGTGFNYRQATHIAVMGEIPPGARTFWEGESKQVTKINWIDDCFKQNKLLPIQAKECSEHLISQPNVMTPVSSQSSGRNCMSTTSKKLKHATRNNSQSARKIDFSDHHSVYHRHLSCEAESEFKEQLYDYALRYRMSEHCELPGCEQTITCEDEDVEIIMPMSVKISKLSTKVIATRSFTRVASMHDDGVALGGNYSAMNFLIYGDDSVKLQGVADAIVIYSDEAADLDYAQFVYMMTEEVFMGQKLPLDLTEWLRIIAQGVQSCNRRLLCNHIDLMQPYQGYGHFVCMYQIFWNVKGTPGWMELLGSLGHYNGWRLEDVKCSFIQSTLEFGDEGKKVTYEDDIRGLLRVLKNTFKHRAKSYQRFAVYIIMNEFRRLLSDLQRALHQGGYLSHLSVNHRW